MSRTDGDLERFRAACDYPGVLDEQAVERELAAYLRALGVCRQIVRLRPGWRVEVHPPLKCHVEQVLNAWVKRHPDAAAVRDSLTAGDALLLEDVDWEDFDWEELGEPAIDTRDPAAAAAVALREVLNGLAYVAAGEAREAYDAFDRRYNRARWVLRVVLPVLNIGFLYVMFGDWLRSHLHLLFRFLDPIFFIAVIVSLPIVIMSLPLLVVQRFQGITADDEKALMARFTANTARAVNKFLDTIPANRGLTSLQKFAAWCIQARGWDLSEKAPALLEARWLRKASVMAWARPLFEAFNAGCWIIYWTKDTLYWVAKPIVHHDQAGWLHHDRLAAVESDIVNLYLLHGVRVPAFVVARPDHITVTHIDRETNAEVRRVMIERYRHGAEIHGPAAFIRDAGAMRVDHDERYGTLWRRDVPEPIVVVEVVNSTRAPDGSFKRYWLRVPPDMRTACEAVAWTFDLRAEQFEPAKET